VVKNALESICRNKLVIPSDTVARGITLLNVVRLHEIDTLGEVDSVELLFANLMAFERQ